MATTFRPLDTSSNIHQHQQQQQQQQQQQRQHTPQSSPSKYVPSLPSINTSNNLYQNISRPNSPLTNHSLPINYPSSPSTSNEISHEQQFVPRSYPPQLTSPLGQGHHGLVSDHELEFPQYYPARPVQEALTPIVHEERQVDFDEPPNIKPFVSKLAHLLNSPDQYSDVIRWDDAGITIIILPSEKFTSDVLPAYFSHGSLAAFNRQLNTYGFSHLSRHQVANRFSPTSPTTIIKDMAGWAHPFFSRADQTRLCRILPKPSKVRDAHRKEKMALLLEEGKSGSSLRSKIEAKAKGNRSEGWKRVN